MSKSNKEKVIQLLEANISEKAKNMFREQEVIQSNLTIFKKIEVDRIIQQKQDIQKEDEVSQFVKTKIHEIQTDQMFQKIGTQLAQCKNLNQQQKDQYSQFFLKLQILFNEMDSGKRKIKIALNKFVQNHTKVTFEEFEKLHDNFIRLQQAGCCGVGTALRNFQADYARFEFIAYCWKILPELENSSVEYQAIRPVFKEKDFRAYIQDLIKKNLPEESGDPQVHENVKYIEIPKIEYVDKYITKEVPTFVDRITEKIIEKEVIKEVPKEIIRNITTPDRIREAHEMLYGIGRPQNVTEALNIYYEEAEVNENVIAFNTIAQIFYEGKFFSQDNNKAFHYWEKSAQVQDPEGLYRVGYFLRKGMIDGFQLSQGRLDNRDKELEESVLYLQQAGEQGHLEALTELGEVFEFGLPSETQEDVMLAQPELEQAEFYYNQGKKMRYPRAIWALGQFYLNHPDYKEKVVGDNSRKALKYFELAKDLGYEKAYLSLARSYENGLGVHPNVEKAKNYYKEGALRGDSECKVSYMYYMVQEASNKGKHEDYQTVYNYLREVLITSPEIPETYYYLGHLYECGFGVNKDPGSALQFYFKGSKLRNASCMNKLGDFYHSGFGVPRNQREALKFYQQAAELQDPSALINMGVIYENGYEGVKPEQVKAFNCYEQAASLNNPKAYFHLGLMYEAGRYVKQDTNYAIELYKKSAQMGCEEARQVLQQKKIPIIYDDGINTAMITIDEEVNLLSALDKQGLTGGNKQKPMIDNPMITHIGKKTNQNIIQSKIQKQSQNDQLNYVSILQSNVNAKYAQSQYQGQ